MRKPNAKERILETAAELFHQRGYSEVGINEIIEKAETAKASFYQHFPSKESLCEAWLENIHERSEKSREELLASDLSPAEKVGVYFEKMADFMKASKFRGCPYSNTGAVSDSSCCGILEQIHEHKKSIRDFFRVVCGEQFNNSEKANDIGDRMFLLYSGAATESQNLKDLWPVDVAANAAQALLKN